LKQENRRACGARNNGIRHARGELLAFLDSDDSWMPDHLRTQVEYLETRPQLHMVYCDCAIYGTGPQAGKTFMQVCPSKGAVSFESLVREDCQIPISSVVVRRQTLVDAGLFDETLPMCDDYEMWLRLAYRGGKISYHKATLARIRVGRANSLSSSNVRMLVALVRILTKVRREWKLSPEQMAVVDDKLALTQALLEVEQGKECLERGEFEQARAFLEQANGYLQRPKLRIALLALRLAPGFAAFGARTWSHWIAKRRPLSG
jgi:glycosyltransferase involved in cell wall biosynthesis